MINKINLAHPENFVILSNLLLTSKLLHYSQHVPTKYLTHITLAIPAAQEFLRQVRQVSHGGEIGGRDLHAIKIRSDTNMIHTDEFHDVIDVVNDARNLHRRWSQDILPLPPSIAGELLVNRIARLTSR